MMVDADTGQVIYEQDADKQLPVASVSKLLTIAVIHDELRKNIITADTRVPVTPAIAAISNDPAYSSIGLAVGQSYSVIELLNAAMVKSADGATSRWLPLPVAHLMNLSWPWKRRHGKLA